MATKGQKTRNPFDAALEEARRSAPPAPSREIPEDHEPPKPKRPAEKRVRLSPAQVMSLAEAAKLDQTVTSQRDPEIIEVFPGEAKPVRYGWGGSDVTHESLRHRGLLEVRRRYPDGDREKLRQAHGERAVAHIAAGDWKAAFEEFHLAERRHEEIKEHAYFITPKGRAWVESAGT